MPYPNEHSARLRDPDDFAANPTWKDGGNGKFRRTKGGSVHGKTVPGTISVVFGKLPGHTGRDDPPQPQSLRFPTRTWTAAEARAWLKDHEIKTKRFEAALGREAKSAATPATVQTDAPPPLIQAEDPPAELKMPVGPDAVSWQHLEAADAGDDGPRKLPRVSMRVYGGGPMTLRGWPYPVVIALAGLDYKTGNHPLLLDHNPADRVGHATKIEIAAGTLYVAGVVSCTTGAAKEVLADARNGFPWQASIGAQPKRVEFLAEGREAKINGRTVRGPMHLVHQSVLGEVSFVPRGADTGSAARVAAAARQQGDSEMTFEQWLEACGIDADGLTDDQRTQLQATFDRANQDPAPGPQLGDGQTPPAKGDGETPAAQASDAGGTEPDPVAQVRERLAAEAERAGAIHEVCGTGHPKILAQALRDGWDRDKTELEVMKADRPKAPAVGGGQRQTDAKILTAAALLGSELPQSQVEAMYEGDEPTLEAADRLRRMGVRELIARACAMEGIAVPALSAEPGEWVQAAFSTHQVSGILADSAHKMMLAAYKAFPSVAKRVAKKLSAENFLTHTGYRLTADLRMRPVGPHGELKHGTAGEQSFTYKVDSVGRYFGLSRQDIINDSMGAFLAIPNEIGRGASLALEFDFWAMVLGNAGTFFGTGNGNYFDGAASDLDHESLSHAVRLLMEQTDPDGNPIALTPRYLTAPPSLKTDADELYVGRNLVAGGGSSKDRQPTRNIHEGQYEPQITPYLSNAAVHANASSLAWYLFADPADVAAFGICYLRGRETPVVEEAPPQGDILGKAWRAYFDYGVCQLDPRGAVKSKGEA